MPLILAIRGSLISTMAMLTTTIATITTPSGSSGVDSDTAALFEFADVWQAYLACRRRKRGTAQAQKYAMSALDHIANTAQALQNRSFTPSRSVCFIARQPKAREIHAATFADRVVHHLLVPRLEAIFEPVFIYDLYSNRIGKGTHAAVNRLQYFMRSLTGDGQPAYFLQLDISNFFNSINRRLLFNLIQQRINKKLIAPTLCVGASQQRSALHDKNRTQSVPGCIPTQSVGTITQSVPGCIPTQSVGTITQSVGTINDQLLWLNRRILTGNPAFNAFHQGNPKDFARVPPHKRLINAPAETGLPIGNLTSQFFANVYLNELDQFIKHQLKCRHYLRYVDDFILLHHDPGQLRLWRQAIEYFLLTHLKLSLKELSEPKPVSAGTDFLGYIIRPHYRLVRRRVVGNLRAKLEEYSRILVPKPGLLRLDPQPREELRAILASYLGHFHHANSQRLIAVLWKRYSWLYELFFSPPPLWGRAGWGVNAPLILRWEPPVVTSLMSQWTYFKATWPNTLILMQVGNRLKCLDQKIDVPMRQQNNLLKRLQNDNTSYILVLEEGYLKRGLKRRVLRERFNRILDRSHALRGNDQTCNLTPLLPSP